MRITAGKRDCYTTGVDRIAEDRVSKLVGEHVDIEFQKAHAIEEALAGSRFSTPKALCCDAATGRIEFEYISNTIRLFDAMQQAYRTQQFATVLEHNRAAGELLATFHRNLRLPSAARWLPPPHMDREIKRAGREWSVQDEVFLHCDFSPVNVLVNDGGDLVLIDASPNQYLTDRVDLIGPPLLDIATYTVKLYWPFRLRTFAFTWRRLAQVWRAEFLDNYERTSGVQLDRNLLAILERGIVRSFVSWKTGSLAILPPAMAVARIALPKW